jgi:pantoate--beta-alanine ligase
VRPNAPTFTAGGLNVYARPDEIARVTRALRSTGRRVMLVPTMGALHDGHLALVRAARQVPGSVVVVSIFVNPLQFGAGEDLDAYPRTLDDDLALLRAAGVELAFTPTAAAMYPDGPRTAVHPGPLGSELEGAARPTHFAGMLTVVGKLLPIVRPDRAFFGEKDYQQLVLVRQMVADLNLDVTVVGVPTVREPDGLALSSRNRYLDPAQREAAAALSAALSAALAAGEHAASGGTAAVLDAAGAVLSAVPAVDVDYLQVRGLDLGPAPLDGPGRLLIAARVGATRLIDNAAVTLGFPIDADVASVGSDGYQVSTRQFSEARRRRDEAGTAAQTRQFSEARRRRDEAGPAGQTRRN